MGIGMLDGLVAWVVYISLVEVWSVRWIVCAGLVFNKKLLRVHLMNMRVPLWGLACICLLRLVAR